MQIDRPRGESEPFFARLSDTWIEGIGRIELVMEFFDDQLRLVQMADVVLRRKLGPSRHESLEHKRFYSFHISSLAENINVVEHMA